MVCKTRRPTDNKIIQNRPTVREMLWTAARSCSAAVPSPLAAARNATAGRTRAGLIEELSGICKLVWWEDWLINDLENHRHSKIEMPATESAQNGFKCRKPSAKRQTMAKWVFLSDCG